MRLYNTLTQKTEEFTPSEAGHARVYVCGVTTYDFAHAGHGRTYTSFDVLVRHLRARGLKVTLVRNVTDVDDKILNRAQELGEAPLQLSQRMSDLVDADLLRIGCDKPTHEPRVSTHIPEILDLIAKLIDKGHAYVAKTDVGNDVYFSVRSFSPYGKLSRRNIDDLLSGARVETGDIKRDPLDFALWKGCEETAWGWPSPYGKGRPGWHIECSAMAEKYLGQHFDIHCGGMDLIFPHHENEIAQSEAAHGPEFARVWLHGGFLNVDKEKMSKSLGNFVTIRDVLSRNDAEAFRYFLLGTHYRGPLSFDVEKDENGRVTFPGVDEAERRVDYLYTTLEGLRATADGAEADTEVNSAHAKVIKSARDKVLDALDNDLNAPVALSVVAELAKASNELTREVSRLKKDPAAQLKLKRLCAAAADALQKSTEPLGLMLATPAEFQARTRAQRLQIRNLDAANIDAKVAERQKARVDKDFARADELRKELTALGIEVLDTQDQSSWRVLV
jgi:cysteinyl-tRNA synthetase